MFRNICKCSLVEWEVWDQPTRFFHWAITGILTGALFTGWFDPPWQLDRHLFFGSMATGLLLFRLLWGVMGSEYSRFSHLLFSPASFLQDLSDLRRGEPRQNRLGLGPVNAWVSLGLLGTLAALVVTGFIAYGGEEHLGPLAAVVSFSLGEQAQELHAKLAILLLVLVALHLLIIWRETRLGRVSLLRGMITGCKPIDVNAREEDYARDANSTWAILIGLLVLFGLDHFSKSLGQLPLDGWRPIHYPAAYQERCGQCHWTIHPSLLPEESWQDLLLHLNQHHGQAVHLSPQEAVSVTSFLMVHAAEDWNTEAAHRFRKHTLNHEEGLTDHPMWRKIHASLDPSLFELPPVKSRINCPVCHHDALSGRFDEHAIHLPTPERKYSLPQVIQ